MNTNKLATSFKTVENALVQKRMNDLNELWPFSLQPCGTLNGANWINDSAATSMEKVAESFIQFEKPVIWIAEVNEENVNFELIRNLVKNKVKAAVVVGEYSNTLFKSLLDELEFFISANSWEEALQMSLIVSKKNDTVLFSPGCRAVEPFENYKDRGAYWNKIVELHSD